MPLDDYTRLIVAERRSDSISVCCLKETAAWLGWDTALEEWTPPMTVSDRGEIRLMMHPAYKGMNPFYGGHRLYLGPVDAPEHPAPAKKLCFRMKGAFSKKHLRMLAALSADKFLWMENQQGKRVSRADWLT